jgi:excinuclease ABC subunit B
MRQAIDETNRRRQKQVAYNRERGVDPTPLRKRIADITDLISREDADTAELLGSGRNQSRGKTANRGRAMRPDTTAATMTRAKLAELPAADLADLIQQLTDQMHSAAAELQFELAARLRDEVGELKKELRGMRSAGHA